MAEIDLIPASWRAARRARGHLRLSGLAIAGILVGLVAGRIGLELSTRNALATVQQMQAARRDTEREAARVTALESRLAELQRQQALVTTLRGEGMVGRSLLPIDRALEADIWFDELGYARQAVPPQPGNSAPPPIEASLQIRGKAPSAAAISRFNDALASQGPCARPTLTPGDTKRYTRFELLEFTIVCPLRPANP